jgi:opacity protein-like surface antigen
MKFKFVLLLVTILLAISAMANSMGLVGVGPRVGYYKAQDADEGNFMGGVAARLKLGSAFGIEGSVDYRAEKYINGALTVRSWPVMVTGIVYPLPILHAMAGFGWYNTTMDYDQSRLAFRLVEDKTQQKVGWHFGGGVDLPLGMLTTLTADIRYVFLDYDFSGVPGGEETKADFYAITVGLLFGL